MAKGLSEKDSRVGLNKVIAKVNFEGLDPNVKTLITLLLNKIEILERVVLTLQEDNQKLPDEINRLKEEHGKPDIWLQIPALAKCLSKKFDVLFSQKPGYDEIDQRMVLTRSHKDARLLVPQYPILPLHNNACELRARVQARKHDIRLYTINAKGTQTAKKYGVSIHQYFYDCITRSYQMPFLASLIKAATEQSTPPLTFQVA
jgi:hypothetical protein